MGLQKEPPQRFLKPLIAGACAGLAVDVALFPIDTIKTRLQSRSGFRASGGFARIYAGLGSAVSGSAPGAALFFLTYETCKRFGTTTDSDRKFVTHMVSASLAETVACLVRVPVEVVKQRAQASQSRSLAILRATVRRDGLRGLYRGYASTVLREIPFSMIQFPLWERLKTGWAAASGQPMVQPHQSMVCGSVAGAVAAFLTTPLDVAKTRIMLAEDGNRLQRPNYLNTIRTIYGTSGIQGLFAGAVPRVAWIAVGGAIFLGGYDWVLSII